MAVLSIPNSFTAGTKAVASQVNANFSAVKSFVEAIASGSNIDAGAITNAKLAADVYNFYVPIGGITQYAGASAPVGGKWLICDGSLVSRTTYSSLFSAIGVAYGAGDGTTTFNLPNLKGRVPIGFDSTQTEFDAMGETGGSKASSANHAHTLSGTAVATGTGITLGPVGDHAHTINGEVATRGLDGPQYDAGVLYDDLGNTVYTESTGTAGGHNHTVTDPTHSHSLNGTAVASGDGSSNLQPYVVVNYIIRVL